MRLGIGDEREKALERRDVYNPMPASEVNGDHMTANEVKAAWG